MKAIDNGEQRYSPEDDESTLNDAGREHVFETSAHVQPIAGGTPGWEAYQRYGYSIWRFDGLNWHVIVAKCSEGAVCGLPPKEAGQYVGEHRKKNCEPAEVTADLPVAAGVGVET
jgi:hypothetical protein